MTLTDTSTSILLDLDFDPSLPCEHNTHAGHHRPDGPAAWVVFSVCPGCGHSRRYLLCDAGHNLFMRPDVMLECEFCELVATWGAFVVTCERLDGAR